MSLQSPLTPASPVTSASPVTPVTPGDHHVASPDGLVSAEVAIPDESSLRRRLRAWTGLPQLTALFVVVTLVAAGPFSGLDDRLHHSWAVLHAPEWVPMLHVLDHVAGQGVDAPILALTAAVLAWRRRTWRPLLIAAGAELAFYGLVGGLKLFFARPAPLLHDPSFFGAGVVQDGWLGISYPSGHAAEAVLIYGTAVYLLVKYAGIGDRTLAWLCAGVAWISVQAVLISFLLGYHWATDLLGGLVVGGLALRLLIHLDVMRPVTPDPGVSDLRACAEGSLRASWIGPMN